MCSVRGAMRSLHEPSPPSMQSVALMYIHKNTFHEKLTQLQSIESKIRIMYNG